MKKPRGIAAFNRIEGGRLTAPDSLKKLFAKAYKAYEGQRIEVRILPQPRKRSLRQNAYYWGVVVPFVRQQLNDLGNTVTNDMTHEFLKLRFLEAQKFINPERGSIEKLTPSTTKLNKDDFGEYIDKIGEWCREYLNCTLPTPGQDVYPVFT